MLGFSPLASAPLGDDGAVALSFIDASAISQCSVTAFASAVLERAGLASVSASCVSTASASAVRGAAAVAAASGNVSANAIILIQVKSSTQSALSVSASTVARFSGGLNAALASSVSATGTRTTFTLANTQISASMAANAIEKWEPALGTPETWTPVDPATEIWQAVPNTSEVWTVVSP